MKPFAAAASPEAGDRARPPGAAALDARMPGGGRLARNLLWSASGWGLSVVLGVLAIPVLVRELGVARFGVLGLSWTLVGYFSLFDLGVGRALTQIVAVRATEGRAAVAGAVWTALWLLLPLGVLGAVAVWAAGPFLVQTVFRVPADLAAETRTALALLALATPFTVVTGGLRGVLEGLQVFGYVTVLRVPLALFTFLAPMLVALRSPTLPAVVGALAVGRVVLWVLHVGLVRRVLPELGRVRAPDRALARPLLALGGWMTVSNVVSPLMASMDRFVVGAVLTLTAVAHYTTAFEAITRLWVITAIVLPVLFPALATALHADPPRAARLVDVGARICLVAVIPMAVLLSAFAPEWLTLWVGESMAGPTAPLAQGLAAAVVVNVFGQLALTVVHASGRAVAAARLHLLEVVPYALGLWWLLHVAGTAGAVVAWGARVLVDSLALTLAAERALPGARPALRRAAVCAMLGAAACLLPVVVPSLRWRAILAALWTLAFGVYAWRHLVGEDGRELLVRFRVRRRTVEQAQELA